MNKFTRLLTIALAAIVSLGTTTGAMAEPTETSDDVSFQVYSGTLDAFVEAGTFADISAGDTSSVGSLTVQVTDGRAPGGDWKVTAALTGFVGEDPSNILPGTRLMLSGGTGTAGPVALNAQIDPGANGTTNGASKQILSLPESAGAGAEWTTGWTATVSNIPSDVATDRYSAKITVTIAGDL